MPTIRSVLTAASESLRTMSESPALDAEVLLCRVLAKDRSHLRAWPDKTLSPVQAKHFSALLQKRLEGTPIAYLTGSREFWSRDFEVNRNVLIPRPDTELLIELALGLLPERQTRHVIDLGTGSGIIAITLAAERPACTVIASDRSADALAIAQRNAEQHAVRNVHFLRSDWFDTVDASDRFDLVLSNPPYLAADDPHLVQGDVRFEPRSALIASHHGLNDIERIAAGARKHLHPQGYLLIEHGYNQLEQVQRIFIELNYQHVRTHPDLSGQPRATCGQWHG